VPERVKQSLVIFDIRGTPGHSDTQNSLWVAHAIYAAHLQLPMGADGASLNIAVALVHVLTILYQCSTYQCLEMYVAIFQQKFWQTVLYCGILAKMCI